MRVLMLLKTTGVQFDDRVRKECRTIEALGSTVDLAVVETENRRYRSRPGPGLEVCASALLSRRVLPQARGIAVKTIEMYLRFLVRGVQLRPDVVWAHNQEMAGLIPILALLRSLGVVGRVVWDQHELASDRVLASRGPRRLWGWLMGLCDRVIVANAERRDLMLEVWKDRLRREDLCILENLCDDEFLSLPRGRLPEAIERWLDGRPFFLAQGGAAPGRHLGPLVRALLAIADVKLVVVGSFNEAERETLSRELGSAFEERVYFSGMVPQMKLVDFIDGALASCVFYARTQPNNWFCAPNRMFQALARGTPVVVGSNPPMKRVVEASGCGVVVSGDGAESDAIRDALTRALADRETLASAARSTVGTMRWEGQAEVVNAVLLKK